MLPIETSTPLSLYSKKFSNLRVNRARSIPPHKPILLLAVIELFEQGLLRKNQIFLSAELIAAFLKYWNNLGATSYRANIALPFFNMTNEGFWHLKAKPGFEFRSSKVSLRKLSALKESVQYVYLDDQLFRLLRDKTSRKTLLKTVADSWFFDQYEQICELLQINTFQEFQEELRDKGGIVYKPEDLKDEEKLTVREAAFRRIVSNVYHYRCAFCGLQVINSLSQTVVDGVHIKPFALSYDDRVDNGISLCKNHQWAFEHGWFTVDDNYRIIISNDLWEESPHGKSMIDFHGKRIFLPNQEQYFPRVESLRWHRENIFNSSTC